MKNKYILMFVMLVVTTLAKAQISDPISTAADYYLPLCVGNQITLNATAGTNWSARWIQYSVIRTEQINGQTFFVEKGYEHSIDSDTGSVFRYLWLRKDDTGNIVIAAFNEDIDNLETAMRIDPPSPFFSNGLVQLGFTQTYTTEPGVTDTDEVLSTTASASGFNNCLKIQKTQKENGVITRIEVNYYAKGVGNVKNEVLFPEGRAHVENLTNFNVDNCNLGIRENELTNNLFSLTPNPTNGVFNVNFTVTTANYKIEVYNFLGQKVFETKNKTQINLESSPKGIYLVKVFDGKNTFTERLLLE